MKMSRRTKTVTITAKGRDQGKMFLITEMSADQAERWATKAGGAMIQAAQNNPDSNDAMGLIFTGSVMTGFATEEDIKEQPDINWEKLSKISNLMLMRLPEKQLRPLLDELMDCVQFIPNPKHPEAPQKLLSSDIEEAKTYARLRNAVYELHSGFFLVEGL